MMVLVVAMVMAVVTWPGDKGDSSGGGNGSGKDWCGGDNDGDNDDSSGRRGSSELF